MSDEPDVRPKDALQVAQRALAKVNELEQRVDTLEDTDDSVGKQGSDIVDYDDRDAAVVDHIEAGESVTVSRIHRLYRRHTDIRSDATLKKRVQGLIAGPEFEIGGVGEILYDPIEVSDDE